MLDVACNEGKHLPVKSQHFTNSFLNSCCLFVFVLYILLIHSISAKHLKILFQHISTSNRNEFEHLLILLLLQIASALTTFIVK